PEPRLRIRLQRAGHPDCRGRALSGHGVVAVAAARGTGDEPVVGVGDFERAAPAELKMFSRRRFVQGLGSGALLLGTGPTLFAASAPRELTGPHFDLTIDTL